jgi:hypothetical protein
MQLNSMRWGINALTGQMMELQSVKCIENKKGRLYLGYWNDDQKQRNQKWKFEFHNPMLINSTDTPRMAASAILQWHRNFSIHNIPFPPLPPIIQHPDTTIMSIAELTTPPSLLQELPEEITLVDEMLDMNATQQKRPTPT